jgi:transposase
MNIRYRVELTTEERDQLSRLLSAGKCAVRRLKRAQILLAAEAGATDEEIARTIGVAGATVYRTKRRFIETPMNRRREKAFGKALAAVP